ncbi:MAG: acetate--CoA ligase family protein, partial [Candidatus ainarchaeum sp.]|nr:acetate--CoA ligase family protein [Candidatus ainarchaeum sp.]
MAARIPEFALLEKYGIRLIPYGIAKDEKEAARIAKKLGYPVALKIISPEITHKTDYHAVKVGLKNEERMLAAYEDIMENVRGHKVTGMLVQSMARKGLELIIGGKKDPQFGHMVVLGLGGVYVEVFRDVSARICPIRKQDVKEMVMELRSHPLITGVRGMKPIDIGSLETLMVKVCRMMVEEDVLEMDLNPVIFDAKGYDIVDVRLRR